MQTVTEALAQWSPPSRPTFDPALYPHRYALDFLTGAGRSVIPDEIRYRIDRKVMAKPNALGQERKRRHPAASMARLMLIAWVEETGEDEDAVYVALADRHLEAQGIERP
ncbi:hypothetical protein PV392_15605 [Streptomyces sp. ME03-5709C]|nr:hypothetical protein [Streptomyces sp. ME03-5709C]